VVDNLSARKTVSISVERNRRNGAYPVDLGVQEAFGDGLRRDRPVPRGDLKRWFVRRIRRDRFRDTAWGTNGLASLHRRRGKDRVA
jgi:hypothetical protein